MPVTITRIERQKKHAKRYSLFCNEQFIIGVSESTLLKFKLHSGCELDDDTIAAITTEESLTAVREQAGRYLSRRPHSIRELSIKLKQKNFPPAHIDRVLRQFRENGYLDDRQFGQMLITEEKRLRKSGPLVIKNKLFKKGLDRELIAQLLEENYSETEQLENACALAEKKLKHLNRSGRELQRKMSAFLQQKGYSWEIVKSVVEQFTGESE